MADNAGSTAYIPPNKMTTTIHESNPPYPFSQGTEYKFYLKNISHSVFLDVVSIMWRCTCKVSGEPDKCV